MKGKFNEDTTITAQYAETEKYTVTYRANGTVVDFETVEEGKTPTNVPEAPAKEGHKFIGWQKDGTGDIYTKEALKKIKITNNTTYVAKYEEVTSEQYLVSFVVDGAVVHSESVAKNGKLVKVPDDPKVSGYIFEGWQKDGAGKLYSKAELKALAVKENVTFIAKLEKEKDIVVPDDPTDPKPSEEYARITLQRASTEALKERR